MISRDELAQDLANQLMDARELTEIIGDYIVEHQPTPATVAFAILIIKKFMEAQIPDWSKIDEFCILTFKEMDAVGAFPQVGRDGRVN